MCANPNAHVLDTLGQMWYSFVVHRSLLSIRMVLTLHATICQRCRPSKKPVLAPSRRCWAGWQEFCTVARKACSVNEWASWGRMSILLPVGVVEQKLETGPNVNSTRAIGPRACVCLDPAPTTPWNYQNGLSEAVRSQCAITDRGLASLFQAINGPS